VQRKINARNTSHANSSLTLALLVLGIAANNAHHATPVNNLALAANFFH
jgi:mannitol/fructose-specific phosphotransferase system IIA component